MIPPSLGSSWVLIRNGKAPPALAQLTRERVTPAASFFCDLMVAETNSNTGQHEWRKRSKYEHAISDSRHRVRLPLQAQSVLGRRSATRIAA